MQIIATLSSNAIVGTRSEKDVGGTYVVNGQYVVCTPPGVAVGVDSTSYMTPQDADSIPGLIATDFLTRNPMYDHVLWDLFIESADITSLDLSSAAPTPTAANVDSGTLPTLVAGPNGPRCKVGRGVGPAPVGIAPNSVTIFPRNDLRTSPTYGSLVTDTVDLTPYTGVNGTDEVLIWWKVAGLATSEDIVSGYGVTAGENSPSLRELEEIGDEPTDFYVYVSVDDGVTWHEARYMEPTDLVTAGTDLRVAFVNEGATEVVLLGFILLFVDVP